MGSSGRAFTALLVAASSLFGCSQPNASSVAPRPARAMASAAPVAAAPKPNEPQALADIPAPADVASPPQDAVVSPSGLITKVLNAGFGKTHPEAVDVLTLSYTAWSTDGKMIDATRDEELRLRPYLVGAGWAEGMLQMTVGEKRRMWIPANLANGSAQVVDTELVAIHPMPEPPAAPSDVAAAPASARKTASGLAYKLLAAGKLTAAKPKPNSVVTIKYTGWRPDGRIFGSSVLNGAPETYELAGMIPGWNEAIRLMHVGDKMRLWIPERLAYGSDQQVAAVNGGGRSPLVYEIELLDTYTLERSPEGIESEPL